MSLNRREFVRRMAAASGLLIVGLVSSLELLQNLSKSDAGGSSTSTVPQTLPPPETTSSQAATAAEQQTVTVTKYASGQSTQQATTSQQSSSSSQTSQAASSTTSVPAGYVLVTPLSALAGRASAYFNHPSQGLSLLLNLAGQWKAFSATCTHAPCTVQYNGSSIHCPCHGGNFNPSNGAVQGGPPPSPLQQFGVLIQNDNLYVTA